MNWCKENNVDGVVKYHRCTGDILIVIECEVNGITHKAMHTLSTLISSLEVEDIKDILCELLYHLKGDIQ